jgi:hypothetical protein
VAVTPSVTITAIEPLISLTEIGVHCSDLIFLAVDITNHSNVTFSYTASFSMSDGLNALPGLLGREPRTALLTACQTTVFILGIRKSDLLASAADVPQKRVMAAVKLEEEKLKHKVDKQRRAVLVERLGITAFVESHLNFEWRIGHGRRGSLTTENSALPTPETLVELRVNRPRASYRFEGFENEQLPCDQRVRLHVVYEDTIVTRCALVLGLYMDPDYGIAWEGTLQGRSIGENTFELVLFFTKPGRFEFRVEYETADRVIGGHRLNVVANEID